MPTLYPLFVCLQCLLPPVTDTAAPPPFPTAAQLDASIQVHYLDAYEILLSEYKETKKGEWLRFLPTLGVTYTATGRPRPTLGISSGLLYTVARSREQRRAKRQALRRQCRADIERSRRQVRALLARRRLLRAELKQEEEVFAIDTQLFAIQTARYHRLEIGPEEYLRAQRTHLLRQQALQQLRRQIQELEIDIRLQAFML